MRRQLFGFSSVLVFSVVCSALAQTPTPPPHVYLADQAIVNTVTTNEQKRASVASGTDGNYLIVWNGDAAQAGYFDIKGQLFTHDGAKLGAEFQVDQAGANRIQYTPHVASGGNGGYVVVWADFNSAVTDSEVWMRRFDAAASPLGGAVQVNTYTTAQQRLPRAAVDSSGQLVVVWESQGQDGNGLGVFGQRYDETGAPSDGEFAVNTATTGDQDHAAVDMDDQGFTVAFNDANSGIAAREFGTSLSDGSTQFPVFSSNRRNPDVARLDGTNNTLFVARDNDTGAIDGVRTENAVAQGPFSVADDGANARIGHRHAVSSARSGGSGPEGGVWVAWDDVPLIQAVAREFGRAPNLQIREIKGRFLLLRGQVPDIDVGPDGQVQAAAQSNAVPAGVVEGGPSFEVVALRGNVPRAEELLVDPASGLAQGAAQNGVLEPGESALFSPRLANNGSAPLSLTGAMAALGGSLTIGDGTADYGAIPPGDSAACQANCYGVTAPGLPRPAAHWDGSVNEALSNGVHKTWNVHIGESFADVPATNLFYAFIENLLHNGVTGGGACGGYCPADGVKRQQMAVFLLKSPFASTFVPFPATGTVFTDVALSNPFAPWIETLARAGITGGCAGGPPPVPAQFCPDAIVNRQQMAVFLLKTFEGSAYVPPAAAGVFQDVPLTNPFVKWIEELYARQVTGGCAVSPPQYCPGNPTNRQQMAAFLVKTFGLQLYGP